MPEQQARRSAHARPHGARLAVAGPGLMGLGIAQAAAAAGVEVLLLGRDAQAAIRGRERCAEQLELQVHRRRLSASQARDLLTRVRAAVSDNELADCTLAIESVPEDRALKHDVLRRLEAGLPDSAVIATNTSGLPVSGLAQVLSRPERLLGLHFFSPAERMRLVEVVRGTCTSDETLHTGLRWVGLLGKTPVVVRDSPGFFTSRVFAAYLDEALALVSEGVDAAQIDAAAVALGRVIGPLALLDELSLALNLQQIRQAQADGLPPERCRPQGEPVLAAMVAAGRCGRRQGGGFHDRLPDGGRSPWPGLAALFAPAPARMSDGLIMDRLRIAEAMEALRCLEEGVLQRAADADTASLLGLAYPSATGGVLAHVERQGLANFVAQADRLAALCGARFLPSPWLRQCAAEGSRLMTPAERAGAFQDA